MNSPRPYPPGALTMGDGGHLMIEAFHLEAPRITHLH
jgi:hypothetical protein